MTDKRTATAWVRQACNDQVDRLARETGGLARAANSLVYKRSVPDGLQKVQLHLIVHPRHAKKMIQVALNVTIEFPEMARIATSMLGVHATEFERKGAVYGAALDSIASSPMFLFSSEEDLASLVPDLRRSIIEKIIPYLGERDTVEKLTALMWRSWSGNKWRGDTAGRWPVFVAAGEAAQGDWESAAEKLEIGYPIGSDERDRYANAFRVVSEHQRGCP